MRRSPALVAIAALIALTARLGWWQLDRAAQKLAVESAMQARHDLPTLDASALARTADQAMQQYHRAVRLTGRWTAPTLYLENRARTTARPASSC